MLLRAQVEKLKKEMAKQDAALRKYESEIAELRQVFFAARNRQWRMMFHPKRARCARLN